MTPATCNRRVVLLRNLKSGPLQKLKSKCSGMDPWGAPYVACLLSAFIIISWRKAIPVYSTHFDLIQHSTRKSCPPFKVPVAIFCFQSRNSNSQWVLMSAGWWCSFLVRIQIAKCLKKKCLSKNVIKLLENSLWLEIITEANSPSVISGYLVTFQWNIRCLTVESCLSKS